MFAYALKCSLAVVYNVWSSDNKYLGILSYNVGNLRERNLSYRSCVRAPHIIIVLKGKRRNSMSTIRVYCIQKNLFNGIVLPIEAHEYN